MAENPSNFYNDNVKYANPPSGGCNWDLDYYRTNYINAILLGQLKEGNYIKSGLVPTQGTGLNIDVTAGIAVIGGVEYSVNAFTKQAVLAPLGSVEFNLIYIDNAGVGQVIQSDPAVIGCALAIVDTDDTAILRFMNAVQLLQYDTTPNPVFQNHIIDGDFNLWYEGVSQTSNGYGSDTMWDNEHSTSTKTHTQEGFSLGQTDVPGNLEYYSRTVVVEDSGVASLVIKGQKIEDVAKLSGKTVTLSFWAKASSSLNIATEFSQVFGTGGSPSTDVTAIGVKKHSLTTSWVKYTATVNIDSVSGKIIGNDGNDSLRLLFWFDAGSNWDLRTDSLGHQSGTFDLARVRIVEGGEDGDHINEDYGETLQKINRFFWYGKLANAGYRGATGNNGSMIAGSMTFNPSMKSAPVITEIVTPIYINCSFSSYEALIEGWSILVTTTALGRYRATGGIFSADARL